MEYDVDIKVNEEKSFKENISVNDFINTENNNSQDAFEELSVLGKGGSAMVYLVKNKQNGKYVFNYCLFYLMNIHIENRSKQHHFLL